MGAPNTLPLTLRAPASPSIWFGSLSALEGRTGLIDTYMDTSILTNDNCIGNGRKVVEVF
jgi:hypothetical protein